MADVPPAPALGEARGGRRDQAKRIVQLATRKKQAAIGGDPGAVELGLNRRSTNATRDVGLLASRIASTSPAATTRPAVTPRSRGPPIAAATPRAAPVMAPPSTVCRQRPRASP